MSWELRLLTTALASFLIIGCGAPAEETPPADEPGKTAEPVDKVKKPPIKPSAPLTKEPSDMATKSPEPDKTPPKPEPGPHPGLLDPAQAQGKAPETFKAQFDTTKGKLVIQVTRSWSPLGADRFYNLVKIGYFTDIAFFRVIDGFMAQFGIHGDPKVNESWSNSNINDDPVNESNLRGYITFAKTGAPNSRSVQFFINYRDNSPLDPQGFSPFARVVSGMEVIDSIYKGYGEGAPRGGGPDQNRVRMQGNRYLKKDFPKLDYIKKATIVD